MMTELSREQAEAFVSAVSQLAAMADRALPRRRSPLTARLVEHLGGVADDVSSTSMSVPSVEHVNVQLALDAHAAAVDRFDVIGLPGDTGNYGGVSLTGLVTDSWHGPEEAARQYVSVQIDVDERIDCLRAGLVLTEFAGSPIVVLMYPTEHRYPPELAIEVVGPDRTTADGFVRHFRGLMHEHNAFRRKVVSFTFGMHGQFGLSFVRLAEVDRDDVVLAPGELEAIEAHSIGITEHAEGLRAAGQHASRAGAPAGNGNVCESAHHRTRCHVGARDIHPASHARRADSARRCLGRASTIGEDAELVALWIGQHDPRHLALTDVDP